MIVGNPYSFAVQFDIVKDWSDTTFKNGIFRYIISGNFFPRDVFNATLGTEMLDLEDLSCIKGEIGDSGLFNLPTNAIYEELSNRVFPDDQDKDNDFTHLVSTQSLNDEGYYFFLLNGNSHARLIGSVSRGAGIFEFSLEKGLFESVIKQVIKEMHLLWYPIQTPNKEK